MHCPLALTSILLIVAARFCHSQQANVSEPSTNSPDHWCGPWAGSPNPAHAPSLQLLPRSDYDRRLFIEPQLQRVPFSPVLGDDPKVQVPKVWGNSDFRIALMSLKTQTRVFASSKSCWADFIKTYQTLLDTCVVKGKTGGAYLLPPVIKKAEPTLVVYIYAVDSYFDYQMNEYMSRPYGINPATIGTTFLQSNSSVDGPAIDVL